MDSFGLLGKPKSEEELRIIKEATKILRDKFDKAGASSYNIRGDESGFGLRIDDMRVEVNVLSLNNQLYTNLTIYVSVNAVDDKHSKSALMLREEDEFRILALCVAPPKGSAFNAGGFITSSASILLGSIEKDETNSLTWSRTDAVENIIKYFERTLKDTGPILDYFCSGTPVDELDIECEIRELESPVQTIFMDLGNDESLDPMGGDAEKFESDEIFDEEKGFDPPEKYTDKFKSPYRFEIETEVKSSDEKPIIISSDDLKVSRNNFYKKKVMEKQPKLDSKVSFKDIQCVSGDSDIDGLSYE